MQFSSEGYVSVPEGRMWYGVTGVTTEKAPLLVLHGGPGYPSDYLFPLGPLSDERQIIFYDQLGCGRSTHTSDHALWTKENFLKQLLVLIDYLSLSSMHILGHSWGTMLLTEYLLTQPSGIRSAIFASPAISNPLWIKDTARYLDMLPENGGAVIRAHEAAGTLATPEYLKAVDVYFKTHEYRLAGSSEYLDAADAGMNLPQYIFMCGPSEYSAIGSMKDYDRTERLHEIKVPALFTCGRYDGASPETTAYYAGKVKDSEVHVFEESSHMPHLEETEKYIQIIRSFLKKHD